MSEEVALSPALSGILASAYEPGGLICAYRFDDGVPTAMRWREVQAAEGEVAPPSFSWLHAKSVDGKIRHWLEAEESIPEHIREFLLGSDTTPCLNASGDSIYGTLVDIKMEISDTGTEKGALHFFLNSRRLLTLRNQALCSTNLLRQEVAGGETFANTTELFAGLLRCLGDGFTDRIEILNDEVDDIEESVLSDRRSEDRAALSAIRRQLAELRRHITPERRLLQQFNRMRPAWVTPAAQEQLAQSMDAFNELHLTLEALYERAKLLQEEIASQMSEQMNRNLMALSILTALLMPATLVSGIFGMNVAGLPGLHDDYAFLTVMGVMLAMGLATVGLLKWMKIW
ncbi:MAG TPA: transporter [Herbaspirillum sp.]